MSTKSAHRRLLTLSVASICKETGFEVASKASMETLTEMLQAHLTELTNSCRKFCEHGHRTTPDLTDVTMALAEVGCSAHALNIYCKNALSQPSKQLSVVKPTADHKCLKSGLPKINQPSYIPSHFIEYPEVHSFVRTPSLREPINQYETVRERVARQNILTDEALIKYLAHTRPSELLLFGNIDQDLYPIIHIENDTYPYLKALLPSQKEINLTDFNQVEEKLDLNAEEYMQSITNSQSSVVSSNCSSIDNAFLREPKRMRAKKKEI